MRISRRSAQYCAPMGGSVPRLERYRDAGTPADDVCRREDELLGAEVPGDLEVQVCLDILPGAEAGGSERPVGGAARKGRIIDTGAVLHVEVVRGNGQVI